MKKLSLMKALFAVFVMALGLTSTASAQNFNFTIQPDMLTLNPGESSSFVISLSPTGGFTNPVTFSVSNLPANVTATFSQDPVDPPGTTVLTLDAATNAATGNFTLYFTGEGGGITNTTTGTATVEFGLLPICYGAIQGQITDTTTGKPVPYAIVAAYSTYNYYAEADANGNFIITNMALGGSDNQPVYYEIEATRSNYWTTYTNAYAVCDATNTVNMQILLQQGGSLTGTLTSTTGQPLTNVSVTAEYQNEYYEETTNGGAFSFPSLALGNDNTAGDYAVYAEPAGYWEVYTNVYIQANSNAVLDLVAIPICYDTVSGKVIYASSGLPAAGVSVQLSTSGNYETTTDANGDYTVTNVELGTDNNAIYATVSAFANGYYSAYTNLYLTNCGESVVEPTVALSLIPVVTYNYGALTGQVFDITSGLPIPYAGVYDYSYGSVEADSNGFYMITNIDVGEDTTTNADNYVVASANNYFSVGSNVEIYANETSTLDFYLLREGYGYIQGTVVDSVSGLPVSGVSVSVPGNPTTDANGFYASTAISLNSGNLPTYEGFYAYKTGYWETYTNTTITNGVTNIVNIDLIKVCTGATIIGKVVDAANQAPITNATVSVNYSQSTSTDTNGEFIITNITVGDDNSPSSVTVTASAPNFIQQSKSVEIFCGATISTVFGVPATNFGAIEGYVTNVLTGAPLTNVFIGSSFGASTYTDTNGYYFLGSVPIFSPGQTWSVTAQPGNYNYSLSKTTPVATNETNVVDFGFGAPPTALVVSNTGTPNPVYVTSNLVYTVTLTNSVNPAANVVLLDTLPPGVTVVSAYLTNDPEGDFSPPVVTNGQVSTAATNFDSNSVVYLFITVTASSPGMITNVATVTSDTPDVDPTDSNHIATAITTVIAPTVTHYADLAISITGAPNPVLVDNQLVYMLYVTNYGPADAPSVYVTNFFPPDVIFSSATPSQGTYTISGNTLLWNVGDVPDVNGPGSASAMIVVEPTLTGTIIDEATVAVGPQSVGGVTVIDTNLANNTAYATNLVTGSTITNESVQYGAIVFDPQTGLYDQSVQYNNLSGVTASAIRVSITGLPNYVTVYNASGVSNNVPYVEYDQPVPGGSNAVFLVEYYDASRKPFASTNFTATVVVAVTIPPPVGTQLQLDNNGQFIDKLGQVTIEFATVPGHTYVVEYSSSVSGPWVAATPPIVAVNTRTQWTDAGPPVTSSPPGGTGNRFYQVVETK